jgi:hypothetical protein
MALGAILTGVAATSQLLGSGLSFTEARKQKRIQADAERRAEQAMASARKSLEKNYMDALAIQKEPYELEREAALVAGAQATEALRESERGMGRVGAIYGQQQQAQREIASAMGQELFNLDYLSAQEDTRLRDIGTQLDLGEVTGAQLEAASAEERRAQQLMSGVKGIGGAAMTGIEGLALYGKQKTPTSGSANGPSMSELVSQADLGLGKSVQGLQSNPYQADMYNIAQIAPPQIPLTLEEQMMSIQTATDSRGTPIGAEPTQYMLPPTKRFLSSLNPFSLFRRN